MSDPTGEETMTRPDCRLGCCDCRCEAMVGNVVNRVVVAKLPVTVGTRTQPTSSIITSISTAIVVVAS